MLDSIYPANLPPGADAYLGYVDGAWPDFQAEVAKFPHAHVLPMAVFPRDDAVGCDREPGDLAITDIAVWVKRQIARGVWRPVVYASVSSMDACMQALRIALVPRPAVRLLTAHYGAGKHICGPATCKLVTVAMDGTQWRDNAPGAGMSLVDESVLLGDFFAPRPTPAQEVFDMSFTEAQLEAAVAKAVSSQPVRDAVATASLWWLDKALSGVVPPTASPGEAALIGSIQASLAKLAAAKPAA
jgi:hypothetical protein